MSLLLLEILHNLILKSLFFSELLAKNGYRLKVWHTILIFIIQNSPFFYIWLLVTITTFFSFSVYVGKRDWLAGLAVPLRTLTKTSPFDFITIVNTRYYLEHSPTYIPLCTTDCTHGSYKIKFQRNYIYLLTYFSIFYNNLM